MKNYQIVIVTLFSCFQLCAQNLVESERFKISFETTEVLENYKTESEFVLGYDNYNYAVDIAIVALENESERFINDLKYGTKEIAKNMGFQNIIEGGSIPSIKAAYYVIADVKEEGLLIPVYILTILNRNLQIAYEITVYCYNLNAIEGEKIVKSFKLKG